MPTPTKERKKMGRPPKEKKGAMVWIPADCIEFVKVYLEMERKKLSLADDKK